MKSELKVEFGNSDMLKSLIEQAYYEQGQLGRLMGKKSILVNEQVDDVFFTIIKGLDVSTIKISNKELIEGTLRVLIEQTEDGSYNLSPVSSYCIGEHNMYSFY
jgi:hypothetical protein